MDTSKLASEDTPESHERSFLSEKTISAFLFLVEIVHNIPDENVLGTVFCLKSREAISSDDGESTIFLKEML